MEFRAAAAHDLPQLKSVYRAIIQNMNSNQIDIWDDVYPCELFDKDVENDRLYVLLIHDEIVSAFALCGASAGEKMVEWKDAHGKALYLDRFGVNVNFLRMGIGGLMLEKAKETARDLGAEYLRLFAVDTNRPAIRLYVKSGFIRVSGVYDEVIDYGRVLHEYGFETALHEYKPIWNENICLGAGISDAHDYQSPRAARGELQGFG